jgi:hypothetical protein
VVDPCTLNKPLTHADVKNETRNTHDKSYFIRNLKIDSIIYITYSSGYSDRRMKIGLTWVSEVAQLKNTNK